MRVACIKGGKIHLRYLDMVWKTAESRETKWAAENIGFVFLYFVWHFLCWKYNRFFNNVHNMLWFINWKMGFPIHMIWFTIWWSRQILLQQIQVVNGVPPTGDYSFAKYNKVNAGSVFTFMPALLTYLMFVYLLWCSLLT